MRALTAPLTTPLVIDDYLKLINPLWSARELRGRIVEVRGHPLGRCEDLDQPGVVVEERRVRHAAGPIAVLGEGGVGAQRPGVGEVQMGGEPAQTPGIRRERENAIVEGLVLVVAGKRLRLEETPEPAQAETEPGESDDPRALVAVTVHRVVLIHHVRPPAPPQGAACRTVPDETANCQMRSRGDILLYKNDTTQIKAGKPDVPGTDICTTSRHT